MTPGSPILIPLLSPLLVCVVVVVVIFLILFCCGCLDCCKFCRDFDSRKDSRHCHLTWYFIKSGCCSFFFCKSGSKRGKCFFGQYEGERCGGCLLCRKKCTCSWPGKCKSKEISCCGCCFCLCCMQEDEEDIEANINANNKGNGSRSAVSKKDVDLQMGEKDVKKDKERPPAFHLGTKHKVESETTRNFDPDEHRPLPPVSGQIENKQRHRPQPQPPEYSDVKDQDLRGLSANYDDVQGLPNDMPTSNRLPPRLAPLQPAIEEDVALKEPKRKKKKKKKKEQLSEGEPEK